MLISIYNGRAWINPDKIIAIFSDEGDSATVQLEDRALSVSSEELKQILAYHNPYEYKYVYGDKTPVDILKES